MGAIKTELRRRNLAAALTLEAAAKRRAPVDTGRLRSSITHQADESGLVYGTNVKYGIHQELGTRHQEPQPFLVPALTASLSALERIYGAEISGRS